MGPFAIAPTTRMVVLPSLSGLREKAEKQQKKRRQTIGLLPKIGLLPYRNTASQTSNGSLPSTKA